MVGGRLHVPAHIQLFYADKWLLLGVTAALFFAATAEKVESGRVKHDRTV